MRDLSQERPVSGAERGLRRGLWIVPAALYVYTASPGMGWIDAPMIASRVFLTSTDTWVNTHNLFHILGRAWSILVPIRDLHYSLNLLCAILGAVTVHTMFLTGCRLTRGPVGPLVGAGALTLSHSLWWHATTLEVYTLNTTLMALMLYSVVRYDQDGGTGHLYRACVFWGLGVANHALMALFVFAFAGLWLTTKRRRELLRPRVLLTAGGCFLAGFQLWLFVFVVDFARELRYAGDESFTTKREVLGEILSRATGGEFRDKMFPELSAVRRFKWRLNYAFTLLMNYPSIAFGLGWVGLVAFARDRLHRAAFVFFAAGLAAQVVWSANYMIWDMYAFGLPAWVLFSLPVMLGAAALWERPGLPRTALIWGAPTLALPLLLYPAIVGWADSPGFWRTYFSSFDYVSNVWDAPRYFANPVKRGYDAADRSADRIFELLPERAHLFDDDGKGYFPLALYRQRVLGQRKDVRIHQIFGPFLDSEQIAKHAREMRLLLERGTEVWVSSPYWPERPVLDRLYADLDPDAAPPPHLLTVDELEQRFPVYRLRRVQLFPDEPFFLYRIERRDPRRTTP